VDGISLACFTSAGCTWRAGERGGADAAPRSRIDLAEASYRSSASFSITRGQIRRTEWLVLSISDVLKDTVIKYRYGEEVRELTIKRTSKVQLCIPGSYAAIPFKEK
jgi:hypothetical protein